MNKTTKTMALAVAVLGLFFIAIGMVGKTVSAKFNNANGAVVSNVTFGGGGDGHPQARRVAPYKYRAKAHKETVHTVVHQFESEPDPAETTHTNYGIHRRTLTSDDPLSTFSIDVDTGSYTSNRAGLNEGAIPVPASVRVEEYVNYFKYDYPAPEDGAFDVHMEAAPSPFATDPNTFVLRVGVQGKTLTKKERKPVHLTFLVDVSGSMLAPDKLPLAKRSLITLTNNLRRGDTIALATYAGRVEKILPPTGMNKKNKIIKAIDGLGAGGGTAMSDGMELAFKMAMSNFKRSHVNRVVVVSDGDANIGPGSHTSILKRIQHYADEGVTLSTIGFGRSYNDTLMEQLANKGNGNYSYIDSDSEAEKVFGTQLDGTLQVIAKDVKIQMEFNPKLVSEYRLIGYENRDIADEDFRNDKVDAGEIGAGHTVTALYELKLNGVSDGQFAIARIRAKKPNGFVADEQTFALTHQQFRSSIATASEDFRFVTSVATYAEILRKSPYVKDLSLDLVLELADTNASRAREDRKEFVELVKLTKEYERLRFVQ